MTDNDTAPDSFPYQGDNNYFPTDKFNIYFADDSDAKWEDFRKQLLDTIQKNQDDLEKILVLLSSGGLIVALTFLDKFFEYKVAVTGKAIIVISIIFFVGSLISNLYSHIIAIKNNENNIEDVDNRNPQIVKNIKKRNKSVRHLNTASSLSISFGTIFLFLFFLLNFF